MYKVNIKILLTLIVITLVGAFLRFYKLDHYPIQLNHDEISQLYDTVSIVQTGKDIYGNFLPLAFPSTGEYKVGHYIYITVLAYLIFGLQEVTVRIPAAFFGTLVIPAVFFFVNQLTKNKHLALLSSAMVAITPSEIFYSRKSFENIVGIFFVFGGLTLLLGELEETRKKTLLFFTPFFLALPMYIYTSHTIVVPFIILVFILLYWQKIKRLKARFIKLFLILGVLILPLTYLTLTNPGIRFRATTVSLFQDINLSNQLQMIDEKNTINRLWTILDFSFTKYLTQFSFGRIFANGLDLTSQGMVGIGPLMLIQFPFLLLGIIFCLKSTFDKNNGRFILALMLLGMLPSGITFEQFSPHRVVFGFSIMSIISAFGAFWFFKLLKNKFKPVTIKVVLAIIFSAFALNFIYFLHIYTVNYPYEKSQNLHYPYKEVAVFAWSQYKNFDHIIIDPKYGQSAPVKAVAVHYYLAYYGGYKPAKFQQDLKINEIGINFDKFSIREIDWRKDYTLKNTLIIASPWSLPESVIKEKEVIKIFTFYDKKVAFYAIKL